MAKRIGLLGGTFDPVHIGHMRSVLEVVDVLALDELRLMPCAQPLHRDKPQVSARQRFEMVHLAVEGIPLLVADARELTRDQPSYTIDILELIRTELAEDDQLFLLLGWDAFCVLPSWYRWQELLHYCHILVLQRQDVDNKLPDALCSLLATQSVNDPSAMTGPNGSIAFVWQTQLAVSATQIRQLLARGKSVRFLVPDAVLAYINAHGLYCALH
ncbi:nicotinate-nucleotide adenylyltransferase [Candidatus Pseudomonas adelgestsugas]|uniref:Probable nicotinate-nucleotide adenylyltransferase n=1 Tax=Candidatus Pseudomonas adelgestsugas TaxID=1302376 RepID=A0ABX5R8L5_9PSED|nr:nicotinate-nucleotide adenylyltransferase [Candidatus Pseudomonas adelgestsugas]QAX81678.1 putative nicotinate-nucleotide adenylyltransferase [Candidatus Pseudomonas adelgestsugas]